MQQKCNVTTPTRYKSVRHQTFISSSGTIRGKSNFNKNNKRRNIFFKEKLVTRRSSGLFQVKTTQNAQRI